MAEMTAALLGAATGLKLEGPLVENSAAYMEHWVNRINEEPSILWDAARQASDAFKYVMTEERLHNRSVVGQP